jgi:hypothetical protein
MVQIGIFHHILVEVPHICTILIIQVTHLEDNGKIHLWSYFNYALLWVKMALFTPVCIYELVAVMGQCLVTVNLLD